MARVIARRTPPYLLVVFVILSLTTGTLAVLFFNQRSEMEQKAVKLEQELKEVARKADLETPEIIKWRQDFRALPAGNPEQKTVVRRLGDQVEQLAQIVTGLPNTPFGEAVAKAETARKEAGSEVRRGLTVELANLGQTARVRDEENEKLKDQVNKLTQSLADEKKKSGDTESGMVAKLRKKDEDIAALDQKFNNLDASHKAKLEAAKAEYDGSIGVQSAKNAEQVTQIATLSEQVQKWKKKYEDAIRPKAKPGIDPGSPGRRPDGKIVRLVASEALAYIDVGSKGRVMEGLRLTVYPHTGIPDSGIGKAVIEVNNVSDSVSECRILQQEKDNPIVPGDLVANVVFDSLRTYNFMVEGLFDPDNTGNATPAGTKAVRELIRRYGGTVAKELTVQTDYLVLGESPVQPKKPEDSDPQEAHDLYQDRLKAFNQYQEVKKQAESLQIPRIGGKRFLDLVGYMPAQAARE
jgi:hypothetical protein